MNGLVIAGIIFGMLWFFGGIIERNMVNGISSGHPIIPEPNNLLATEEEE